MAYHAVRLHWTALLAVVILLHLTLWHADHPHRSTPTPGGAMAHHEVGPIADATDELAVSASTPHLPCLVSTASPPPDVPSCGLPTIPASIVPVLTTLFHRSTPVPVCPGGPERQALLQRFLL